MPLSGAPITAVAGTRATKGDNDMKKTLIVFLLFCAILPAGAAAAQEDEPQPISAYGDEMCNILEDNPADLLYLVPLRFVIRVAIANEVGGDDVLYQFLYDNGITMDEMIDLTLEDSGMLEDGAGAQYFGEEPEEYCYWADPAEVDCSEMFDSLTQIGLMNGTVPASYETLLNASSEQNLQSCALIKVTTDTENLDMALLMFDNLWYMVTMWDLDEIEEY